jgi:hypothetical protein
MQISYHNEYQQMHAYTYGIKLLLGGRGRGRGSIGCSSVQQLQNLVELLLLGVQLLPHRILTLEEEFYILSVFLPNSQHLVQCAWIDGSLRC